MYYEIDEALARRAHEANSFRDYVEGSETAEYRGAVDAAQAVADGHKKKVSHFYHERIDGLVNAYSRRLARWYNDYNRNRASCPSIMVAGGSNFPVAKKERQNARSESLFTEYDEIQSILEKIKSVGTGPVDLADPNAREILQEQLDAAIKKQKNAKIINAYFRKHKTVVGCDLLDGETAARIQSALESAASGYSMHTVPFHSYELSSMREKIKRIQARIEQLDKMQEISAEEKTIDFDGGQIVRNVEQDRLQIMFDEKPDEDLRAKLKAHGFRWSPSNGAWQRQLTENAVTAAKQVLGL